MTKTLYDLVEKWTKRPWDGKRYLNITQKLGELLDKESHSEKYQGAIIGVLEGTIKLVHEMMQDNLLTETEAIQELGKLLSDSDFKRGAKRMEVELTESVSEVGVSISNFEELRSGKNREECGTPTWWKGSVEKYWISIISIFFVVEFSIYWGLVVQGLWEVLLWTTFVFGPLGGFVIAYYIRKVRYPSVFRSTLTIGTIIGIVSSWGIIIALNCFPNMIPSVFLQSLSVLILGMTIGGFSGEWFGKRQRYISYF